MYGEYGSNSAVKLADLQSFMEADPYLLSTRFPSLFLS